MLSYQNLEQSFTQTNIKKNKKPKSIKTHDKNPSFTLVSKTVRKFVEETMFIQSIIKILLIMLFIDMVRPSPVFGVPRWVAKSKQRLNERINQCDRNVAVRELCAACSGQSGSVLAYHVCCLGRDNVRGFCKSFVNYEVGEN